MSKSVLLCQTGPEAYTEHEQHGFRLGWWLSETMSAILGNLFVQSPYNEQHGFHLGWWWWLHSGGKERGEGGGSVQRRTARRSPGRELERERAESRELETLAEISPESRELET